MKLLRRQFKRDVSVYKDKELNNDKSSFKELLMKLKQYLHECYTDSFRANGLKAVYGELLEFIEAITLKEALYELHQVCL